MADSRMLFALLIQPHPCVCTTLGATVFMLMTKVFVQMCMLYKYKNYSAS